MFIYKPYTTLMIIGLLCYMVPDLKYDKEVWNGFGIAFIIVKWFLLLVIVSLQIASEIMKKPFLYVIISNIILLRSYMAFYDFTGGK
jgi:hypothetical protein